MALLNFNFGEGKQRSHEMTMQQAALAAAMAQEQERNRGAIELENTRGINAQTMARIQQELDIAAKSGVPVAELSKLLPGIVANLQQENDNKQLKGRTQGKINEAEAAYAGVEGLPPSNMNPGLREAAQWNLQTMTKAPGEAANAATTIKLQPGETAVAPSGFVGQPNVRSGASTFETGEGYDAEGNKIPSTKITQPAPYTVSVEKQREAEEKARQTQASPIGPKPMSQWPPRKVATESDPGSPLTSPAVLPAPPSMSGGLLDPRTRNMLAPPPTVEEIAKARMIRDMRKKVMSKGEGARSYLPETQEVLSNIGGQPFGSRTIPSATQPLHQIQQQLLQELLGNPQRAKQLGF